MPFEPNVSFCAAELYHARQYTGLCINILGNLLLRYQEHAPAYNLLGVAFRNSGQDELAKQAWERNLSLAGDSVEVCSNMAGLYCDSAEPDKALDWIARAEKCGSDPGMRCNKALALLTRGDFEEGWKCYESRRLKDGFDTRPTVECQGWDGRPVKHLYIHGEQGVGDEIMFASPIPKLLHLAERITIEVNPKVAGIVKQTWPEFTVVKDATPGDYDAKIPIGSLIGMFGTNPKPYLEPHPEKVAFYRRELEKLGRGPYVALTWIGGSKQTRVLSRSIRLGDLKPIMDRFTCVSAQYSHPGGSQEAIRQDREKFGLPEINPESAGGDLHDQAALFRAVDRVVTVQQTAVHVAGAVGARCHAIIGEKPHWRYGLTADTMPWYESVRLYRKKTDWAEVVERVNADL